MTATVADVETAAHVALEALISLHRTLLQSHTKMGSCWHTRLQDQLDVLHECPILPPQVQELVFEHCNTPSLCIMAQAQKRWLPTVRRTTYSRLRRFGGHCARHIRSPLRLLHQLESTELIANTDSPLKPRSEQQPQSALSDILGCADIELRALWDTQGDTARMRH